MPRHGENREMADQSEREGSFGGISLVFPFSFFGLFLAFVFLVCFLIAAGLL